MRALYFHFIGIVMGLLLTLPLFSQSVGINDDGSQPNAAAILDIKSSNKGLLIPRTDTTTINTLGTPTNGLIIYQTTDDVFYYYDGSRWRGLYTSDNAVFERDGTLIRQKGNVDDDDFIFGRDALPESGEDVALDNFLFFDQSKGAFRMGYVHGMNWSPDSIGVGSFAHGYSTLATGYNSTAWGNSSKASGFESTAWGSYSKALNTNSTVWGFNTQALGDGSTAWGLSTQVNGNQSTAWGHSTQTTGDQSTAWGLSTQAIGGSSTAWGYSTQAIGGSSTAWGDHSEATGIISTAWGNNTIAPSFVETVLGRYNTEYSPNSAGLWDTDDRLFVIGNGTSSSARSNALTILKNGNTTLKGELTLTDGTSAYTLPNTDGSADQVLSTDGAGIMSWTDRDDFGVFERDGNLIRQKGNVDTDDFIFGRDALPENGEIVDDRMFFFDQLKGSFRSGRLNNSEKWSPDSIGFDSFAHGYNTKAKGDNSTAWGYWTNATGNNSTAWGHSTISPSYGETVLGRFNTDYIPNNSTSWNDNDRLFVIGNGSSPSNRSNALTILKNGNTTLKGELTLTDGTSPYTLPNTDGSADQVLSTDGAGAMSWTDRDDFGVFERDGTLIRQKGNVDNDNFIFGRDALPMNGESVLDTFFFFDQSKAAFRMGSVNGVNCSPDSMGFGSFALGRNNKAKGGFAGAWGDINQAIGNYSTAWGYGTEATENYSTAWGLHTDATGFCSTAWGSVTVAPSAYETVLGRHNTEYSPNDPYYWDIEDRLFVIGNGTSSSDQSNALTMLKNGNTTLKGELTLTDGTSPYTLPNTDGTVDQVLSTDGAGIMSWTDRDDFGVFERDGTLIRQKGNVDTDDFIFGRDALPANGEVVVHDRLMFFDQSKPAFRMGYVNGVNCSPDSIGVNSFALGYNTIAKGENSAAWGYQSMAINFTATAWGGNSHSSGDYSTSWGFGTKASGNKSTAWGHFTIAPSYAETVLGHYNTEYSPYSTTVSNSTDRLFVIGNGNFQTRSNALTMLKNGNTTLKGELTLTDGTSAYTLPNTDGTADQVLSTDGAGAMSWTDRNDFGIFERNGTLIRQESNVSTDDFIFGRTTLPVNGESVTNKFLFFDKSKGSLRTGELNASSDWSPENSGIGSLAWGYNCKAKGDYSTAKGFDAWAIGYSSSAWGYLTNANKEYSTAWGGSTTANGNYSTAWGNHTHAESHLETVLGQYNTDYSPSSTSSWNENDRLFVIGRGTSASDLKNAVTVLKSGCVGLQGIDNPDWALELPNSTEVSEGWALANHWGTYSDDRIKSRQEQISYGLNEVMRLKPKSYVQHNSRKENKEIVIDLDKGRNEVGLIAQEVYDIIPEVVYKPDDENVELWSMSYEKLVPVLVKAIQEQQEMIEQLEQSLIEEKEEKENLNARLEKIEKLLSDRNMMQ